MEQIQRDELRSRAMADQAATTRLEFLLELAGSGKLKGLMVSGEADMAAALRSMSDRELALVAAILLADYGDLMLARSPSGE